jgi:hypothetical protein
VLLPRQRLKLARGAKDEEHVMSQQINVRVAVVGVDIGKNSFHVVGQRTTGDGGSVFPALVKTGDPDGPPEAYPLMRSQAR